MKLDQLRTEIKRLVVQYAEELYAKKPFAPDETVIPPSGKLLGPGELSMMTEAVLDGWLTTGRHNAEFENELGKFLGIEHVITVNSGSSANLVAFNTLTSEKLGDRAIKKGDEIITVAAGFPTTVNPAVQFGAIPVFVDVCSKTHNIDANLIEAAISNKSKAIMIAHTLGNPFDVKRVKEICEKHNLWLIEDCCDALGATQYGKKVGTWGDIATLSFYPAHHITMGEGGAVFTNNHQLKMIAESYRDWGRDCYCASGCDNTCGRRFDQQHGELPHGYDHKYVYSHAGYNLKITDMQAACGLAQLRQLENFIQIRRRNFNFLRQRLDSLSDFFEFTEPTNNSDPSWFGFPLTIKESSGIKRVDLVRYLDSRKIGTRLLFAGNLIRQPYFKNVTYRVSGTLHNTERTMSQTFWIGVQPSLTIDALEFVGGALEEYFGMNF